MGPARELSGIRCILCTPIRAVHAVAPVWADVGRTWHHGGMQILGYFPEHASILYVDMPSSHLNYVAA